MTIIAKFNIQDDSFKKVKEELLKMVGPTYKEKGCVDYIFYDDLQDASALFLYEIWNSEEDLNAHMESPHFKNCFAEIEGMYELEVHRLKKTE